MSQIERLETTLTPYREQLIHHPLYSKITSIKAIQIFMQEHVFAVWDFMSLLKSLQNGLTCTSTPWVPKGNPITRRLINEIVFGEESDLNETGEPKSHFEMYLDAMQQIHANTAPISSFLDKMIAEPNQFNNHLAEAEISEATKEFVQFTMECVATNQLHIIAAVFTFGREDLIPDMFIEIVKGISEEQNIEISKLIYYLERHIEVDGGEHGPMALQMIHELCGTDEQKWEEASAYAIQALQKRIALWDGIEDLLMR